ncbi:MAG: gamma-glutamyltransferase [Planctomycetes bacterium]|nr:gamma-glutamyltransferase [Planctomycetota bacterium]
MALLTVVTIACQAAPAPSERVDASRETGARAVAELGSATGVLGAAASAESHATLEAMRVLEEGGSAVDAAITLGFALAVTYPNAGNLGGGGFFLYRSPEGESWYLDFREVAPLAATLEMYLDEEGDPDRKASTRGWKAAGVPGSVFGMWEAHQRWGSLPWARLIQPAIELAEYGFEISFAEAAALNRLKSAFSEDAYAASVFVRSDGRPWIQRDVLRQPALASTLSAIATEGESALREGSIVRAIVAASQEGGGVLAMEDFAEYEPIIRPVHTIAWHDMEVLTITPPSSGSLFLGQTLPVLEEFPLAQWGWRDPRTVQLIGEAEAAAFRDRNRWLGDPASMEFSWIDLLDPSYLGQRALALDPELYTSPDEDLPMPPFESTETTHYSVLDAQGGAVAVTTTLNSSYGAKVMAPGGFLMNNEMDDFAALPGHANQYGLVQSEANAVIAGRRPLSSMSPVIVVKNGKVDSVIGSPGGPTILTTVLQVLLNRYTFEMAPEDAVAAPRFHRQDRPPTLRYEAGRLGRPTLQALQALGQPLAEIRSLGDVNAIFRDGSEWVAVADSRRGGLGQVAVIGSDG